MWNDARGGSQALDGYSSATAADYTGTNSPIIWTWNCHDANNNLVADGNYKFWVQYAEDAGQGPYTTSGLLWTKGSAAVTNTYPNQGANFANMRVGGASVVTPNSMSADALATTLFVLGREEGCASLSRGPTPRRFSSSGNPTGASSSSPAPDSRA